MKLKIAVCDDEKYFGNKIKELLEGYLSERGLTGDIRLFLSGKEFLLRKEEIISYDIVFLDINMSETDGIQTAMGIRSFHSETEIVFVTACINYALEGYKVNAIRYIMKDTLEAAVPECMDAILKKRQLKQVAFPFMEGEKKLYTDNILYVESRRHKAVFTCLEETALQYQIYDKLDYIEEQLTGYGFLRIQKSYLVNMKHIKKISNYTVWLDTGEELPVPRLKFQAVKEAFVAYKGEM